MCKILFVTFKFPVPVFSSLRLFCSTINLCITCSKIEKNCTKTRKPLAFSLKQVYLILSSYLSCSLYGSCWSRFPYWSHPYRGSFKTPKFPTGYPICTRNDPSIHGLENSRSYWCTNVRITHQSYHWIHWILHKETHFQRNKTNTGTQGWKTVGESFILRQTLPVQRKASVWKKTSFNRPDCRTVHRRREATSGSFARSWCRDLHDWCR